MAEHDHQHDHHHRDPAPDHRWLAATLPFVRDQLPPPPARVLELGCGWLGGFVPALRLEGYDAIGIDPEAPVGPEFHQVEFEQYETRESADAVVASTSLHHVADVQDVVDRIGRALAPGGVVVVVEWAHELFDEATAEWCFARLGATDDDASWLHHHRDRWKESGQDWDSYRRVTLEGEGLHPATAIVEALDARFERLELTRGPYYFTALDGTSRDEEQAAIDADEIRPGSIRFVGRMA